MRRFRNQQAEPSTESSAGPPAEPSAEPSAESSAGPPAASSQSTTNNHIEIECDGSLFKDMTLLKFWKEFQELKNNKKESSDNDYYIDTFYLKKY